MGILETTNFRLFWHYTLLLGESEKKIFWWTKYFHNGPYNIGYCHCCFHNIYKKALLSRRYHDLWILEHVNKIVSLFKCLYLSFFAQHNKDSTTARHLNWRKIKSNLRVLLLFTRTPCGVWIVQAQWLFLLLVLATVILFVQACCPIRKCFWVIMLG